MKKIHVVRLTLEQRAELRRLAHAQTTPVATATRARILLHADAGEHGPAWTDEAIHQEVRVGRATIWRLRKCFATTGLEAALARRPTPPRLDRRSLDGEQEAHLIALACSPPPEGHARWTLRLLANRFAELECGVPISHELARRTLKKTT
jgi:transposase